MAVKGKFFVGTTRLSDSFKTWQNEEIKEDDRINGSCWDYGSLSIEKATLMVVFPSILIVMVLLVQSDHFL